MPVKTGSRFESEDVFVDYDYEDVKFRWDHRQQKVFRKFKTDGEEKEVPFSNNLFNEALRYGTEISSHAYRSR